MDFDIRKIVWNSDSLNILFLLASKLTTISTASQHHVETFLCQESVANLLNDHIPKMFPTVQSLDATSYVSLTQLTRILPLSITCQQRLISLCSRSLVDCIELEDEAKINDRRFMLVLDCSVGMLYNLCQIDPLAYGSVARACLITLLNVLEDLASLTTPASQAVRKWLSSLSDKLMHLFIRGAQEEPQQLSSIKLDPLLSQLATTSSHLQHITLFLLQLQLQALASASVSATTPNPTKKNPKTSIKQPRSSNHENKSKRIKFIEKLFKSGYILTIARFATHYSANVRRLSVEIVHACLYDASPETHVTNVEHIISQGIVVVWECQLSGVAVASPSPATTIPVFPEAEVQQKLVELLQLTTNTFAASSALQNKLCDVLANTANSLLRNSLLSSMLVMAAHSNDVKRESTSDVHAGIFRQPLINAFTDESFQEAKSLLSIPTLFYKDAYKRRQNTSMSCQTVDTRPLQERMTDAGAVKVIHEGHIIKIQCPNMGTVGLHSLKLELLFKSNAEIVLPGSHAAWQEIFSHMTDEYLLDKSLSSLKVPAIMELHTIAAQYEMLTLLPRYERVIMQNLNVANFFEFATFVINGVVENIDKPYHSLFMCSTVLIFACDRIQQLVQPRDGRGVRRFSDLFHSMIRIMILDCRRTES